MRISRLAKIPPLYQDMLTSLNSEKDQLFELYRLEGRGFERHSLYCKKCRAICLSIYYKISFSIKMVWLKLRFVVFNHYYCEIGF